MPIPTGDPIHEALVPWAPWSFAELPGGAWLAAYGPDLCGWIDIAPDSGAAPAWWPILIRDDGPAFPVSAGRDTRCDQTPLAGAITARADGTTAFLASGAARSLSGFARLQAPLNLYVADPQGVPRRLAEGLVDPYDLLWSPDGTRLLALATVAGTRGLWLYDLAGARRLLYEGKPSAAAWSPDGRRVGLLIPEAEPTVEQPHPTVSLEFLAVPAAS